LVADEENFMILRDGTKIPRPKNEPKHKPSKSPKKKETEPSETNEFVPRDEEPVEKDDTSSKNKEPTHH
jgi:hypothetical protein